MLDPVVYWPGENFCKSYTINCKSFTVEKFRGLIGNRATANEIECTIGFGYTRLTSNCESFPMITFEFCMLRNFSTSNDLQCMVLFSSFLNGQHEPTIYAHVIKNNVHIVSGVSFNISLSDSHPWYQFP